MVVPNVCEKHDGNYQIQTQRPRKFLFNLGSYDVAAHHNGPYFVISIWDGRTKIGTIELAQYYANIATVYSVNTRIAEGYQGAGIAYRTYEGLVLQTNISIISGCQSVGAIKLWRRFMSNRRLRIYFVAGHDTLFEADTYDVELVDGQLHGVSHGKHFDPYVTEGSLLLIRRDSPLEKALIQYRLLNEQRRLVQTTFRRYDQHKLSKAATYVPDLRLE